MFKLGGRSGGKGQSNNTAGDHRAGRITAHSRSRRFGRDESGALVIYTLFLFFMMLIIGGLAIDVMRAENDRAMVQNTIDRAVLAATDLDSSADPVDVVNDYMNKAGLGHLSFTPTVTESGSYPVLTGRSVELTTQSRVPTLFMSLLGIHSLGTVADSGAIETINDIEISLILDVSGSMGQNGQDGGTKIENLQAAAKKFIDQILTTTAADRVTISIVPYSTQVSAGPVLSALYNFTNEHAYSFCADFAASAFSTTTLSPSASLQRTGHFDPWTWYNNSRGTGPSRLVCRTENAFHIQPWSDDADALKTQIDALTAEGNTSIDVAVKWGTALLDPSSRTVLGNLADAGVVREVYRGRPHDYNRASTLKFMIVMTDGINTAQYYLNNGYDDGLSDIWRDASGNGNGAGNERFSAQDREVGDSDGDGRYNEDYFIFRNFGGGGGRYFDNQPKGGASAQRLTWPQVWAEMSLSAHAYYGRYAQRYQSSDYWDWYYDPRSYIPASTKDSRLDTICSAAKNQNIEIFTIGFEVTDYSAQVMESCASTPNHFYRVEGLEIGYAFSSIANQINQLKLTQ